MALQSPQNNGWYLSESGLSVDSAGGAAVPCAAEALLGRGEFG
jgi:hypothetical protein